MGEDSSSRGIQRMILHGIFICSEIVPIGVCPGETGETGYPDMGVIRGETGYPGYGRRHRYLIERSQVTTPYNTSKSHLNDQG